jgi:ribA/ribD-fused uncharacterized protein
MDDTQHLEELRSRFSSGEKLDYLFFWGHQPMQHGINDSCFSQWYESPFVVDGQRYLTAEHFMMAGKAALFEDEEMRTRILAAPTPAETKSLGRKVRRFDESLWRQNRFSIVVRASEAKFSQNLALRSYLIGTGTRILVEADPIDRVWGIGLGQEDERAKNPILWRGLNLLGFALMQVRTNLI